MYKSKGTFFLDKNESKEKLLDIKYYFSFDYENQS